MACWRAIQLLALVLLTEIAAEEDPLLPFKAYLDQDQLVTLCWGFDDVQGNITFELAVNTTGWVSFGLSPNGDMMAADLVMGGVKSDGHYFGDYHVNGNDMPTLDEKQSYNLLSLSEVDGQTIMRFERSIMACDPDDNSITTTPQKFIYAYGPTDKIGYHFKLRGAKELNLLKFIPRSVPTESHHFDLTLDKFVVPLEDTHYECRVMPAPPFPEKQHIYRIEPLIEHPAVVHHLLIYKCIQYGNETLQMECSKIPKTKMCYHILAAWGTGGGDFEVPEQVGIPIGGDEGDFMYRLEIHYNNPTFTEGLIDNSGLRLHYTPNLRKYDAGILMTGLAVWPGYSIPPNASSFHAYGLCETSLISEAVSGSMPDLHMFAVALHTHLAGRMIRVGHFRDGKQLGFLALDEYFDFELQQNINLGKTRTVKMGDSLIVECTYDTKNRTDVTQGGYGTQEEMCLAFFFYYPALPISNCISFPNMTSMMPKTVASSRKKMQASDPTIWDDEAITEHEKTLKSLPQITSVIDKHINFWRGEGRIVDMMESPTHSCKTTPTSSPATTVPPDPVSMANKMPCTPYALWLLVAVAVLIP